MIVRSLIVDFHKDLVWPDKLVHYYSINWTRYLWLIATAEKKIVLDKKHLLEYIVVLSEWLYNMTVQKLVIIIKSADTNEVLERWQFDVECDKTVTEDRCVLQFGL